jgi:V/A-type H+-transporting ATPase subunit A
MTSYSEYLTDLEPWFEANVSPEFVRYRNEIMKILHEESNLMEIVKLIGSDVLPDDQKLILEISRVIRLGFVQQNAYHPLDTYVPLNKQLKMMEVIYYLYEKSLLLVNMGMPVSLLREDDIFERVIAIKYNIGNDELDKLEDFKKEIDAFYNRLYDKNA